MRAFYPKGTPARAARVLFPALCVIAAAASLLVGRARDAGLHGTIVAAAGMSLLLMIAAHDIRTLRAPNRLVYPGLLIALAGAWTLGLDAGRDAFLGGLVAFLVLLVVAAIGRGAMGMGDVKLGALCGIIVGLRGVFPMLAVAFLSGAALAAILLLLKLRHRKDVLPFTPFLVAGSCYCLLLMDAYLWGTA